MNMDDFEKKLRRQELRKIPGDWRAEILQSAQAEATGAAARRPEPVLLSVGLTIWRELIQPCRYAWSGMAALWLVFWMINAQTRPAERPTQMARSTRRTTQQMRFLEQRQVMAELTGDSSPAEPAHQTHPKPRSERKSEARNC